MSFEINWEQINNDSGLNSAIQEKLNDYLTDLTLPSYIQDLQILELSMGTLPPRLTLKQITSPHPMIEPHPNDNDIQTLLELQYEGDMSLKLSVSLVLNYPADKFMTLPVKVQVSQLQLHCLCLVAYLREKKQMIFSVLCDIGDDVENGENGTHMDANENTPRELRSRNMGDSLDYWYKPSALSSVSTSPLERVAIIRQLKVETEIGDGDATVLSPTDRSTGSTLRNVDKLEEFILAKLKDFIRNEIGWPSWLTLDFNDDEASSSASESEEESE